MTAEGTGGVARRGFLLGGAALGVGALAAACTSNKHDDAAAAPTNTGGGGGGNAAPGKTVTIGFAGPQADHGWLNAINLYAKAEAAKYSDVKLEITEGRTTSPSR
jgi:ribose transport system substrate-binding protein